MEEVDHCAPRPLKRHKASSSQTTPDYASDKAYEVFLNFRGPDSRHTIADVLHRHLTNAGFRVFLDDEEIRKGEVIEGELLAAITNSAIYIPIFSKNYAFSKWCLRELAKMIECWKTSRSSDTVKVILPIFYDVDVTQDVKLRSQVYLLPLQKLKELGEDVEPWEEALREVAKIKGWNLKDHGLSELVDLITKYVSSKFLTSLPDDFVGIDEPVQSIMEKLEKESPGVRYIVIHGMGGIGKTTLAEAVFKKISSDYEGNCFLKDVRRSRSDDDMVKLQKKLLSDTLNQKNIVSDIGDGICKISTRLRKKNVLIVLDDVDKRDHLLKLAAKSFWFGHKSRIIITTRNIEFLPAKDNKEYYFYEMPEMDGRHALKLFCRHAFEMDKPPPHFYDISTEIVDTTGRLPLALQVIGSSLYNQNNGTWRFRLRKLKEAPYKDVQETLMISYQALEYEQQQIFLDIACLFNNEKITYPLYFWEACKLDPDSSIEILMRRSLIKVLDHDILWMHDQLRDLGRAIAQPTTPCLKSRFPAKPSRLWSPECALDALHSRKVAESIIAIKLRKPGANCRLVPEEFTGAGNLKFLELEGGNFEGDFKNVPQQLTWLSWFDCSVRLEATNLSFKNLVILKLGSSDIDEDWGGWAALMESKHLKVVHLEHCKRLKKTPNFSTLMQLERLILRCCSALEDIDISIYKLKQLKCLEISGAYLIGLARPQLIHGSIGNLKSLKVPEICYAGLTELHHPIGKLTLLVELDLSDSGIKELPDSIGDLKCLNILRMEGSKIECLPDTIGGLVSLEELDLESSDIKLLPETIGNLERLKAINVSWSKIRMLPKTLVRLGNLERLEASVCYEMDGDLPEDIGKLSHLRILDLWGTAISRVPPSINQLSHLQKLYLKGIHEPQELLKLPTNLICLSVFSSSLESHRVPDLSHMTNLESLTLCKESNNKSDWASSSPCDQTPQMKWLTRLTKLKHLGLQIPNVVSPPVELSCFSCLQSLAVVCFDLRSLHPLPSSLGALTLLHVKSLTETDWQCSSSWNNVSSLGLQYCPLKEINFACTKRVSNLSCLRELRRLYLGFCPYLVDIEGLGELKNLQELEVDTCSSIRRLPDLSGLKKLERLEIRDCRSLESLPDVDEEVPCHLEIFSCHYFHDFEGPYSECDRAVKNEDSLSDSDRGSDDGGSNGSSDNIGDSDNDNDGGSDRNDDW